MAKIYGLFGTMKGKVADVVMSVRNGEQIARRYQPVVYNPSTPAQVATRAKLKLLSQLSAVMAPVIAIPRVGTVSSRNMFTKENYPLSTFTTDQADITLANVQLTKSVVDLPNVTATRESSNLQVGLEAITAPVDVNRVVYSVFAKDANSKLRLIGSAVATTAGNNNTWTTTLPAVGAELVVYAYGIRDNTERARATFGNMETVTAETVAKLIVTRSLLESDVTATITRGIVVAAPNSKQEEEGDNTKKSK